MRVFARLKRDERGASAVEYGLICALIVIAVAGGITMLGSKTLNMWNGVANNVSTAG
jgi:pilus assembly protein Flp/PilA